jgi:predicted S18 family serine protease
MYENFLISLDKKVDNVRKYNNLHSSRFLGEDMYPQVANGGSWKSQSYDDRIYLHFGELWVSQDVFRIVSNTSGIFSISTMMYIESIYSSQPCRLRISDTILELNNEIDYNLVVYPFDDFESLDSVYVEFITREIL